MILIIGFILLLFSIVVAIELYRSVKKTNALNKIYRQRLQKKIFFKWKFFFVDNLIILLSFGIPIVIFIFSARFAGAYLIKRNIKFNELEMSIFLLLTIILIVILIFKISINKRILYNYFDRYIYKKYRRKSGKRNAVLFKTLYFFILKINSVLWLLSCLFFAYVIVFILIAILYAATINPLFKELYVVFSSIFLIFHNDLHHVSYLLLSPIIYLGIVWSIGNYYFKIINYTTINELLDKDLRNPILFLRTFDNENEMFYSGTIKENTFAELKEFLNFITIFLKQSNSVRSYMTIFLINPNILVSYKSLYSKQPISIIIDKYSDSWWPILLFYRDLRKKKPKLFKNYFIRNFVEKTLFKFLKGMLTNKKKSSYTFEDFFDEIIYEKIGPFIALGNPSENEYKFNGAIREYFADEKWKTIFQDYLQKSKYVFLTVSNSTQNLNWEILTIRNLDFLHKLFVFTKPQANDSQYEASWVDFANQLNQQGFSLESTFPGYGCLITFDNSGKQIILVKDAQMPKEYLAPLLKIENG